MKAHGGSDSAKVSDDGPNRFERADPSSQSRRGHRTPPPATDDVPPRSKYAKPKFSFSSDHWARPPASSTPDDIRSNSQPDLPQPVNDGPFSWQGLLDPPICILKTFWSIACWLVSYRFLKFLAWISVILAALCIFPQCWLWLKSLPSGPMSLFPFDFGFGGFFGSGNNAHTEAPPTIFYPPRHGGVLEEISSQSYVLRQSYSSIFQATGGDLPAGIPLTVAANAVYATHKHFSKTVRKYEACYRDWQNEALLSCQQLFTLNVTLVYCQGLNGERADLSWKDSIRAIFVTADPPRRSSCVADLVTTALRQGFNYRQDLSRSSECFRQVSRDLTPKRQLEEQIADLEYRLREIEPIPGAEDVLQLVLSAFQSLKISHKLLITAKEDLKREEKSIDNGIFGHDNAMREMTAWSNQLKSAIKAGEAEDGKRVSVETELKEFLEAELAICRARGPRE